MRTTRTNSSSAVLKNERIIIFNSGCFDIIYSPFLSLEQQYGHEEQSLPQEDLPCFFLTTFTVITAITKTTAKPIIKYSHQSIIYPLFLRLILPLLTKTIMVITTAQTTAKMNAVHHQEPIT